MQPLDLAQRKQSLSVLCLGAYSDDSERGAILHWIAIAVRAKAYWCVLSNAGARPTDAAAFLTGATSSKFQLDSILAYNPFPASLSKRTASRSFTQELCMEIGDGEGGTRVVSWGCVHPTFPLEIDAPEDRCAVPQHNVIKLAISQESFPYTPRLSNGFWKAVGEVWSKVREQRRWVHKTANVLNRLLKSIEPKSKTALQNA